MIQPNRNNGIRNDNPRSGSNGNGWGGIEILKVKESI
jgi:hypothetical protein